MEEKNKKIPWQIRHDRREKAAYSQPIKTKAYKVEKTILDQPKPSNEPTDTAQMALFS